MSMPELNKIYHGDCVDMTTGECHEHAPPPAVPVTPEQKQCDCENPEPKEGVALVSEYCPVHNLRPKERFDE